MSTETNSKSCQTSEMELFPGSRSSLQRQTKNIAKHLRRSFLQKLSETKCCSLFAQKPLSWMFEKVLNILRSWLPKLKMFHF